MTVLLRKLQRATSDKRYVIELLPGDRVRIRKFRHRHGFAWSIADFFRVMSKFAADAEIARRKKK